MDHLSNPVEVLTTEAEKLSRCTPMYGAERGLMLKTAMAWGSTASVVDLVRMAPALSIVIQSAGWFETGHRARVPGVMQGNGSLVSAGAGFWSGSCMISSH